jgi:cephalosporin-C deacetylase-like acetyl esterase
MTTKELVLKIIAIIGYKGNQEEFADKLFLLCDQRAILALIEGLPTEKQAELKEKTSKEADLQKVREIIDSYFSKEEYTKAFIAAFEKTLQEYLATVAPTLSEPKLDEIEKLLDTASSTV